MCNNSISRQNNVGRNVFSYFKTYGIFIDENLKWNFHINYNNSRKKFFYVFNTLRKRLLPKLRTMTYNFGSIIYDILYDTLLEKCL